MSKKCRAYSESKLGLEPPDNRKSFYAGWDAALAQQAEPFTPDAIRTTQTAWKMGYDAAKAETQQAEPQTTHSAECWRWHHKCAVAKIERECKHD